MWPPLGSVVHESPSRGDWRPDFTKIPRMLSWSIREVLTLRVSWGGGVQTWLSLLPGIRSWNLCNLVLWGHVDTDAFGQPLRVIYQGRPRKIHETCTFHERPVTNCCSQRSLLFSNIYMHVHMHALHHNGVHRREQQLLTFRCLCNHVYHDRPSSWQVVQHRQRLPRIRHLPDWLSISSVLGKGHTHKWQCTRNTWHTHQQNNNHDKVSASK